MISPRLEQISEGMDQGQWSDFQAQDIHSTDKILGPSLCFLQSILSQQSSSASK